MRGSALPPAVKPTKIAEKRFCHPMGGTSENAYFFVILPFRYHLVPLIILSSALLLPFPIPCFLLLHLSLFFFPISAISAELQMVKEREQSKKSNSTHALSLTHTSTHCSYPVIIISG